MKIFLTVISCLACYVRMIHGAALAPSFASQAALKTVFTSPSLIQEPNGQYWAFGTSNVTEVNVPFAQSLDFNSWTLQSGDALPSAGLWAASIPNVQSPDVNFLNNGQYMMLYSAALATNSTIQCIGKAYSDNIRGPYQPEADPFVCPEHEGGATDPSAFQDPVDDSLYVLYKVNGNSLVPGGLCANNLPNETANSTPIMIQQVTSLNASSLVGLPTILLQRGADEGPTLGSPSMTAAWNADAPNGFAYFLFYSSGCTNSVKYDTRYATNLQGPAAGLFSKASTPLMKSGDGKNLHSPGGLDISGDAEHVLFSSYEHAYVTGPQQLRTGLVKIEGLVATI